MMTLKHIAGHVVLGAAALMLAVPALPTVQAAKLVDLGGQCALEARVLAAAGAQGMSVARATNMRDTLQNTCRGQAEALGDTTLVRKIDEMIRVLNNLISTGVSLRSATETTQQAAGGITSAGGSSLALDSSVGADLTQAALGLDIQIAPPAAAAATNTAATGASNTAATTQQPAAAAPATTGMQSTTTASAGTANTAGNPADTTTQAVSGVGATNPTAADKKGNVYGNVCGVWATRVNTEFKAKTVANADGTTTTTEAPKAERTHDSFYKHYMCTALIGGIPADGENVVCINSDAQVIRGEDKLPKAVSGTLLDSCAAVLTPTGMAGFEAVLAWIYNILWGLSLVIGVAVIVISGLQYSLSATGMADDGAAIDRIKYAIGGIILMSLAGTIMKFINPLFFN